MRIGIQMAQSGTTATADAARASAAAAESLGYHSLWVLDRLLAPLEPTLDPVATLVFAAAHTQRVRLGTSVLVAPWYPPVLLARSLASLDVLSGGRLTAGLGLGWSAEERTAAGVEHRALATRLDSLLDVLDTEWGPASAGGLQPVQRPRPPVLLAGSTGSSFRRVARRADGWNPVGVPIDEIAGCFATIRDLAAGYGRDPDHLQLVVRAAVELTPAALDGSRPSYHGTIDQVADDLVATRRAGAHEVILGIADRAGDLDAALDGYAALAEALELRAAA